VAYGAKVGTKWSAVIDGDEGKKYDGITAGTLAFSPDCKRVAYGAKVGARWSVVIDGKEGKPYDGIMMRTLIFSPDGKRVAYGAELGSKQFVVVDEKEARQYDTIVTLGGGKIVFDSADSLHYLAAKGGGIYLVEHRMK
jgi:roadblock/LC7 domain-containing protein